MFHGTHPAARLRSAALALTTLLLAAAGCDRGDFQEFLGEVRPWQGQPDLGGTAVAFVEFKDEVGDLAGTERRALIKTREAYQSYFGHAPPAGVNLPDEWVIFYAAGTKPSGGHAARVRQLWRLQVGQQGGLRAVTRLESPGAGCVVTDAITRPFVLIKFKAQLGTSFIDFLRDDMVTDCGGTPTNPCAAILCPVNTQCVVLESFPPQARCVPIPTDPGPCATVRCRAGFHCEAKPIVCVTTPCNPIAECVADAPRCGGIAGIRCPGAGQCDDDPSDSCDPRKGGADCGGRCACKAMAACIAGHEWDSSPSVCACVPRK